MPLLSYPGLRYAQKIKFCMHFIFFSENVCLRSKLDLQLKKKTKKNLGQVFKFKTEKFLCRIWKLYGKNFFKKKSNQFFLSALCSTVLKKPQKWFNFFF